MLMTRSGNHANLNVECGDVSKCSSSTPVSDVSDPLHEQIDFGNDALFYVGGIPSDITVSDFYFKKFNSNFVIGIFDLKEIIFCYSCQ